MNMEEEEEILLNKPDRDNLDVLRSQKAQIESLEERVAAERTGRLAAEQNLCEVEKQLESARLEAEAETAGEAGERR